MKKISQKILKYTAIFEPAKDAIQLYLSVLKEDGEEIPQEKEDYFWTSLKKQIQLKKSL